jgi:hypothetical protein
VARRAGRAGRSGAGGPQRGTNEYTNGLRVNIFRTEPTSAGIPPMISPPWLPRSTAALVKHSDGGLQHSASTLSYTRPNSINASCDHQLNPLRRRQTCRLECCCTRSENQDREEGGHCESQPNDVREHNCQQGANGVATTITQECSTRRPGCTPLPVGPDPPCRSVERRGVVAESFQRRLVLVDQAVTSGVLCRALHCGPGNCWLPNNDPRSP